MKEIVIMLIVKPLTYMVSCFHFLSREFFMATIDKLDIGIYIQYARRTQMVEEINQQYHLQEASTIPPQTLVIDYFPKLTELDMLMGIVPMMTPWAYFYPPKRFRYRRRSPFAFYRIAPTLGSLKDQEEMEEKLEEYKCQTAEEEKEKATIQSCFKQIDKINSWLSYIVGRIGQFLQG